MKVNKSKAATQPIYVIICPCFHFPFYVQIDMFGLLPWSICFFPHSCNWCGAQMIDNIWEIGSVVYLCKEKKLSCSWGYFIKHWTKIILACQLYFCRGYHFVNIRVNWCLESRKNRRTYQQFEMFLTMFLAIKLMNLPPIIRSEHPIVPPACSHEEVSFRKLKTPSWNMCNNCGLTEILLCSFLSVAMVCVLAKHS